MVAAAAWGVVAKAPVKVDARGIVFQEGILLDIASVTAGRIVDLNLKLGSHVAEGDIVARLARFEIELDLQKTRSDLSDVRNRFAGLRAFYVDDEDRETIAEKARLDIIQDTQTQVVRRVSLLEKKVDSVRSLLDRRLVIRDRLIEAELELANARERVLQFENEKKTIALRRLERESKTRFMLLDEQLKINELQRRLARQLVACIPAPAPERQSLRSLAIIAAAPLLGRLRVPSQLAADRPCRPAQLHPDPAQRSTLAAPDLDPYPLTQAQLLVSSSHRNNTLAGVALVP